MSEYLLLIAIVVLAGVLLGRFSQKMGLPVMLLFTAMGIAAGYLWPQELREAQTPEFFWNINVWGMILIVFYGGFALRITEAKKRLKQEAFLISIAGGILIALLLAFLCWQVWAMPFGEGIMLAAVLGVSDVSALFQLFRSGKVKLKDNSAAMIALISGGSIPVAAVLISVGAALQGSNAPVMALWVLARQIILGVVCGILLGMFSVFVMRSMEFFRDGMDFLFLIGIAFGAYALPSMLGGSGLLSVWIIGLYLGDANLSGKRELTRSMESITSLVQVMMFFVLGLSVWLAPVLPILDMTAVLLFALVVVIKPLVYYLLTRFWRLPLPQVLLLSQFSVAGAPTAGLACLAAYLAPETGQTVLPIAFVTVVLSVLVKNSGLAYLSERMELESPEGSNRMMFNDFQEQRELQSLCLLIDSGHPYVGKEVQELKLPEGLRLALIRRRGWVIPPQMDTHIMEGDELVLGAAASEEPGSVHLWEVQVKQDHIWKGRKVSDLDLNSASLLVAINRKGTMIYPETWLTFEEGDRVIIYSQKKSLW